MADKLSHQETADLLDRYHQRAKEIYEGATYIIGNKTFDVTISNIKNVEICEEGAFIEARVWVSKNDLDKR